MNANSGAVIAADGNLAYAVGDPGFGMNPSVMSAAYADSVQAGPTPYVIDSRLDVLAFENPPNTGMLHTVGPLGVDIGEAGGFSVSPESGVGYAALLPANSSNSVLYQTNLVMCAATSRGEIGGGVVITAMAIPEPAALALVVCGVIVVCIARLLIYIRQLRWITCKISPKLTSSALSKLPETNLGHRDRLQRRQTDWAHRCSQPNR